MRKAEKETVLGLVTTVAIRAGEWQPVESTVFVGLLNEQTFVLGKQDVINALWAMAEDGLLEIVTFEGKDYLIPSPELAAMIAPSKLRVT